MATLYTARHKENADQVQTFDELSWLTVWQPSGNWILIKKETVDNTQININTNQKPQKKKNCGCS